MDGEQFKVGNAIKMNIIKQKKGIRLSQKEMSEKLGTSQQTISRLEKQRLKIYLVVY